ncbi:hypothetical protein GCM10011400_69380 [Paraburkholderia caffeinilytica]|uniref:DUF2946 domain-containing protein n=2 Tax=Paraburkholderia caffeinilytica TaxID=1761016 RepID=A0ABQ1NCU1_9BURK|nr:hypothetical protein GCM10011400_69380 [Paraburkholderia caffeinilytica]
MATLAPTISHSLAARNGGAAGMEGGLCSAPSMAFMPEKDTMSFLPFMQHRASDDPDSKQAQQQTQQQTQQQAPHSAMSDGDACGYCSLLAHMPVVPSVEALFFVTVRAVQHTIATRFERVRRAEPLTFAQPRAPPFAS